MNNKKMIVTFSIILAIIVLAITIYTVIGFKKCNSIKQALVGKTYSGIASTYEDYKKVEGDAFYLVVDFVDEKTCNIKYVYYVDYTGYTSNSGKNEDKNVPYSITPSLGGVNFNISYPAPSTEAPFVITENNGVITIATKDFKRGLPMVMQEGLAWK